MHSHPKRSSAPKPKGLPCIRPDAAGIDIGSKEIYVALPPDREAPRVRAFGSVTAELNALCTWLHDNRVTTVAMESTGVYWIPLCHILENAGIEVFLVNARAVKHVPGRKSDVQDCQWLQQLHSVGLMRASFRPAQEIDAIRTLQRHRDGLVKSRVRQIHLLHKTLRMMNVQIDTAVSDITGDTGMRILRAILDGDHDPHHLATLRDSRCKKTEAEIAQALQGTYTHEHLFALRQTLSLYDTYTQHLQTCDAELLAHYEAFARTQGTASSDDLPPRRSSHKKLVEHDERVRTQLFAMSGVDLTQIDGIGITAAQAIIAGIGVDMTPWATTKHFCAWLGAAPRVDISGGKVLHTAKKKKTPANPVLVTLRMCAQTLEHSHSTLGSWFRRMKAKLGAACAVTAAAHKFARIIYTMLKSKTQFLSLTLQEYELDRRQQQLNYIRRIAKRHGFVLQPAVS
jgi:transposase